MPDVISLLQAGELTPDTFGWHAGCSKWVPLRELPALADFLNKAAAVTDEGEERVDDDTPQERPAEQESEGEPAEKAPADTAFPLPNGEARRVYLPSPTARLLARFVDYGLYAVLYGAIISLQGIPYDASLLLSANPLLWLPLLILEAWMLSTWGTTPGKALMGIRVTTIGDAPRLGFMRALMRALTIFTLGMGLMIPYLLPIMLAFEYWMLRRRGITPWDARNSTLPTQKEPASPSRYTLAVILLYVCSVLFFSSMRPWMPGMIDDIGRENPEMAQSLRELMPAEQPTAAPTATPAPDTPAPTKAPSAPAPQDTSLPGM